jgi:TRAP-type C4-dicarboxylate transport system permease small subunit
MNAYRTFTRWYAQLLSWLLVISVAVLVIPVSMQIFSRTIPIIPAYIWTEEMARFLFVWSVMIGSMIGIREGTHFEVDIWPRMGPRPTALVKLVAGLFITVFALVFLWWGWEFTWTARNRISELAELPLWMIHAAWPLAGLTWVLFQAELLIEHALVALGRKQPPAPPLKVTP